MTSIQVNPVYKFAETQMRPTIDTSHLVGKHESIQPDITKLIDELQSLKQIQMTMRSELTILLDVCNKIGESVAEVHNKLSQYDIDGGEGSDDDEVNGSADDIEQHTAGVSVNELGGILDTDPTDDSEKTSIHTTKSKYTKQPKK